MEVGHSVVGHVIGRRRVYRLVDGSSELRTLTQRLLMRWQWGGSGSYKVDHTEWIIQFTKVMQKDHDQVRGSGTIENRGPTVADLFKHLRDFLLSDNSIGPRGSSSRFIHATIPSCRVSVLCLYFIMI